MELAKIRNRIRGWLPKDQSIQIGTYTQSSQNPEKSEDTDKLLTKGQTNALVAFGVANFIMLVLSSSYLVIYLITPSIWASTLGLSLWVLFGAVMLSVNYLLYRNYRKQTRLAEAV
jgi:hypothetical protein